MISFNLSFVAYYILSNCLESLYTEKTLIKFEEQSQDHPQTGNNETKTTTTRIFLFNTI